MTTFSQAYLKHGPDTIAIAEALDIKEHEAETLIYDHMTKAHERLARLRANHQDVRKQLRQAEARA